MKSDIPVLILARSGSKRVKNKNLALINNKPLVVIAVEKSLSVSEAVYVSSDSDVILDICESYGAKTIKRPIEISGDHASSISAVIHFFQKTEHNKVCLLQATCPLIQPVHIQNGLKKYSSGNFDSVVSATKEKIYIWDENRQPVNFKVENRNRSQEHKHVFVENGGFYISNKKNIIKNESFFAGQVEFEEIEKIFSIDIDTQEDLDLARVISQGASK